MSQDKGIEYVKEQLKADVKMFNKMAKHPENATPAFFRGYAMGLQGYLKQLKTPAARTA